MASVQVKSGAKHRLIKWYGTLCLADDDRRIWICNHRHDNEVDAQFCALTYLNELKAESNAIKENEEVEVHHVIQREQEPDDFQQEQMSDDF